MESIQLFENQQIRCIWDEKSETWYFSIIDVVAVLTQSSNPRKYWSVLKSRIKKESNELTTICSQLKLMAADGKFYYSDVADQRQLFRIIQSIPSPKAEPFKIWMATVASERIDEIQDPELAIDRAVENYRKKGYGEEWIKQRLQGKSVRKELTDEWKRRGVKENQYAILTDIITKEWSGMTTREYKQFKGLKKENLRDHMTNMETVLNTLAEATTTEFSKQSHPKGIEQNKHVAKAGGKVAKDTRQSIERELGYSLVSPNNAKSLGGYSSAGQIEEQSDSTQD